MFLKLMSLAVLVLITTVNASAQISGPVAAHQGSEHGNGLPVPPILSIEHPSSPFGPNRPFTKIEIYANGRVVKTTVQAVPGQAQPTVTFSLVTVYQGSMADLNKCVTEISKVSFQPTETSCQDDPGTHYKGIFGKSEFAVRRCGQLEVTSVACAPGAVELLDKLDALANHQGM